MPHPLTVPIDRPRFGGWVTLDAMPVTELLAHAGFDYLGIDTQHGFLDVAAATRLLYAATPDGVPVLIRVPANDAAAIGKLLDCGADGVIVPMVESAEQAAAAVAACRYAPDGIRSFGPVRRHLGRDPAALAARAACFAMIETVAAVEQAEAICATPGLTGIYLGPADLAVSMGLPPGDAAPRLIEAQRRVAAAARAAGIVAGSHALSGPHARTLAADGFTMLSLAADKAYMLAGAAAILAEARGQ